MDPIVSISRLSKGYRRGGQLVPVLVPELRSPRALRLVYLKEGGRSRAAQAFQYLSAAATRSTSS